MLQLILDLPFPRLLTLNDVLTTGREPVLHELQHYARNLQPEMIFIHGPGACGKSHMLRCFLGSLIQNGARAALYATPHPEALLEHLPLCDWIAIDNLDIWLPDEAQSFFLLLNECKELGVGLICASRKPPAQLTSRDDLRSRLNAGLVFSLPQLNEASLGAALLIEAQAQGLYLPEPLIQYMLRHAPRDMHHLRTILLELDRQSLREKRPVNLSMLKQILSKETKPSA